MKMTYSDFVIEKNNNRITISNTVKIKKEEYKLEYIIVDDKIHLNQTCDIYDLHKIPTDILYNTILLGYLFEMLHNKYPYIKDIKELLKINKSLEDNEIKALIFYKGNKNNEVHNF